MERHAVPGFVSDSDLFVDFKVTWAEMISDDLRATAWTTTKEFFKYFVDEGFADALWEEIAPTAPDSDSDAEVDGDDLLHEVDLFDSDDEPDEYVGLADVRLQTVNTDSDSEDGSDDSQIVMIELDDDDTGNAVGNPMLRFDIWERCRMALRDHIIQTEPEPRAKRQRVASSTEV